VNVGILVSASKLIKSDLAIVVCVVVYGFIEGFVWFRDLIRGDDVVTVLVTITHMPTSKVVSSLIT